MGEPDDPSALPARTTPTWEVELLISGVAVFAMLQLPGWLDDRMFMLEPQLGDEWRVVLLLAYLYAKSAAVVLGITFAMHLLLRAQWIALVGMHSVYPQGVRLDRLRMGPIQRAIEESRHDGGGPEAIERADNRASVVFAIGVSVALIIATVCVLFCGALLVATLLSQALGFSFDPMRIMVGLFIVVMVPFLAAAAADQSLAGKLPAASPARRAIAAILLFYTRIGMGRRNNQVVAILTSNGGERRMMALVVGAMVAAIVGVSLSFIAMRKGGAIGSYGHFPDSESRAVDAAHYDDQRDPRRDGARPFVQSAVVVGPYLRLVVPYRPNRDQAAMRTQCAHAARMEDEARASARLACLQSLHAVTLDGRPIEDLQYEIASDPRTDRPALLAMIDIRELPRGRHELRVARPPRGDRARNPDDRDPGYDAIPFWR